MISLYSLNNRQREIEEALSIADGELTQDIQAMISSYSESRDDRLEALCVLIKNSDAEAGMLKTEIDRLTGLKKLAENRSKRLREAVQCSLEESETWTKGTHALSYSKSQAVEVDDAVDGVYALPEVYLRVKTTIEPNKEELSKALKQGFEVTGARLITRYNLRLK